VHVGWLIGTGGQLNAETIAFFSGSCTREFVPHYPGHISN
jgi:hypothetical protein